MQKAVNQIGKDIDNTEIVLYNLETIPNEKFKTIKTYYTRERLD